MGIFQAVELVWEGTTYTVPSDRVMEVISVVEEVITINELNEVTRGGRIQLTKIAKAYAAVLAYAGVPNINPEKVYAGMFTKTDVQTTVSRAIAGLLMLMVPSDIAEQAASYVAEDANAPGKKPPNRQTRRAAARSSKSSTKRPSQPGK